MAVDELYEGMVLKNKAHFKQHMALYALRKRLRLRNTRSSPEVLVMRCIIRTCLWRVYATKIKNIEKYEVRKTSLHHTCSVDERVGNNRQTYQLSMLFYLKSNFLDINNLTGSFYLKPKHIIPCLLCFSYYRIRTPSYTWSYWRIDEVQICW